MYGRTEYVSATLVLVLAACLSRVGQAEVIPITAEVKHGSSIAVGFGHLGKDDHGPYVLEITLTKAKEVEGEIDYSKCEDTSGENLWKQPREIHGTGATHAYETAGLLTANSTHAALFNGTFLVEGEGDGTKPKFDVAVNEIDVDVDSLNLFPAGRSPTDSDDEDDREYLGDNPSTSTPPGMIMLLREGWAPIVVSATVKKPGTFQLAASGATGSFQFSQDGSTVLPGAVIFPSDDVEEGSLSRTGYVRPHPENAAIDSQITITGTITPKDNSHKAQDKVIVNMGVDLYIEDMSPRPVLPLGDDLTVDYKIYGPATFSFDYVELHVYNSSDVLIYKRTDLNTSVGDHSTSWPKAKWNQSPHSDAYANPTNGQYKVKVVGKKKGGSETSSDSMNINTVLILELELADVKPASGQISSGICPNAVNPSNPTRIVLGVQPAVPPDEVTPTLGTGVAEFSNKTFVDLDNDPTVLEVRDARVTQEMASGLSDGSYHVIVKRLRDKAGNLNAQGYPASGDVSVINDWTIRMY